MSKKTILMLGHQSKVGKDTLADLLVERSGFKKIAFADKLKEICSDLFFIPLHEFYDEALKNEVVSKYGITRRRILQIVGQGMFTVDKCVWVNHAIEKFGDLNKIVITDFRFPHEIERIQTFSSDYEVTTIKLHRDGVPEFSGSNDPSELALMEYPWPYHIYNNGTLDELHESALKILEERHRG